MPPQEHIIKLGDLTSDIRADTLTRSQEFLLPYADGIAMIWTVLWVGTLAYLILRHLLAPTLFESSDPQEDEA